MTLVNYKLHKNNMEKSSSNKKEVISILNYIPEQLDKQVLKCIPPTPDISVQEVSLPSPCLPEPIDSRQLSENKISIKLTLEEQLPIRTELISMINEAINESKSVVYDKIKTIYNNGVQETLLLSLEDLSSGSCLYSLLDFYQKKIESYLEIIKDEIDFEKLNYPLTKNKGSTSAFINLKNIINEKLKFAESNRFKHENLQPIR